MKDKIKPVITGDVTVTVEQQPSFNGKYTLVAVHPDGTEKPGTEFEIDVKGYNKLYKSLTESDTPQFSIKKNPTK